MCDPSLREIAIRVKKHKRHALDAPLARSDAEGDQKLNQAGITDD
jgi:hypothetical protein